LSSLSVFTAFEVWLLANLLLLAVAVFALLRAHGRSLMDGRPGTLLFLAIALLFQPAIDTLQYGQVDIVILAGVALAYLALRSGRPGWSGFPLAIATLLKLYPAVLVIYLALKREWRALVSFVVSLVALIVVSIPFLGLGPWSSYLTEVLPRSGGGTTWVENQSFVGFLGRLLTDRIELEDFPANPALQAQIVGIGGYVWAAALLGISCWFARKRSTRQSTDYALGFALFAVVSVLVLPVAWYHYVTLMLLPVGIILFSLEESVLSWRREGPARPRGFVAILVLLALAVVWLTFGSYTLVWSGTNLGGWWTLLLSYKFYAMVALWGVCLWFLATLREPVGAHNRVGEDVVVQEALPAEAGGGG